ncbi:EsaB/YukD family protein [Niallia sp. Krafla_26]|uniref:EsaB/YukD family protein n=1 Tax=Niallia sp. Krafla_26 TaxID=3064703 RepID=UPI003D168575
MADEKAIVILNIHERNVTVDLEVPLNISANELVIALNEAYDLNIDVSNVKNCYLKTENPIALLKGNKQLSEFGVRNGTIINIT